MFWSRLGTFAGCFGVRKCQCRLGKFIAADLVLQCSVRDPLATVQPPGHLQGFSSGSAQSGCQPASSVMAVSWSPFPYANTSVTGCWAASEHGWSSSQWLSRRSSAQKCHRGVFQCRASFVDFVKFSARLELHRLFAVRICAQCCLAGS